MLCGNVFLCGLFRASCYGTYSCLYTFSCSQVHLYICTFGKDVRWNHRGTRLGALFRVVLCGDVFLWTLFRVVMNMCLSKIVCVIIAQHVAEVGGTKNTNFQNSMGALSNTISFAPRISEQNDPFLVFWGSQKWHFECPNQNSKTTFQKKYPHFGPPKSDFWPFY